MWVWLAGVLPVLSMICAMEEPDALSLLSCKWCIKFAYQQIYMAYSNHAQNLLKSSAFQVQVPDQPRKGQQLQQVEVAMAPLLP